MMLVRVLLNLKRWACRYVAGWFVGRLLGLPAVASCEPADQQRSDRAGAGEHGDVNQMFAAATGRMPQGSLAQHNHVFVHLPSSKLNP